MSQQSTSAPQKCAKCNAPEFQIEKVVMYGKFGTMGMGFRFDVYICRRCGYSENYFTGRARWV